MSDRRTPARRPCSGPHFTRPGCAIGFTIGRLPGSPDLVFPRYRAVIFVHGCYWHSHGCYKSTVPKSRREFWEDKFRANRERDERNVALLRERGWRVLTVWECELIGKTRAAAG